MPSKTLDLIVPPTVNVCAGQDGLDDDDAADQHRREAVRPGAMVELELRESTRGEKIPALLAWVRLHETSAGIGNCGRGALVWQRHGGMETWGIPHAAYQPRLHCIEGQRIELARLRPQRYAARCR